MWAYFPLFKLTLLPLSHPLTETVSVQYLFLSVLLAAWSQGPKKRFTIEGEGKSCVL